MLSSIKHCNKNNHMLVCPPTGPVHEACNAASCESAAFLKHESVINLCHTIVLKTFPPMFIKGPGYWTCSLASPITLTLTCPTHPVNRHTVSLTDNGILMLRQGSLRSAESIPLQELTAGLQRLNSVVEPDQPFQPVIHWWIVFAIVVILVLLLVTSAVGYSYVLRYARRCILQTQANCRHCNEYLLHQHL